MWPGLRRRAVDTPLRQWFESKSLVARLVALVLLFLLGIVWVSIPDDPVPAANTSSRPAVPAAERPVLAREGQEATSTVAPGAGFLTPYQEPTANPSGITWYSAIRTIVSVAIVLALIVAGAQGLRALGVATSSTGTSGSIRVRETVRLPLAGSKSPATLHLVEVGERLLLVGASEGGVSLVTEFELDEVEALPGAGTPRGPGAMGRAEARRAVGADGPEPAKPVSTDEGAVLASVLRRLGDSGRRLRGDE
jgi:flagellar biogenesis protein FliO